MKVAFVCDSGTGRTVEEMKQYGIYSLPLQLEVDGKSYLEFETISIKDSHALCAGESMVKTSLPPLGLIDETFNQIKSEGYDTVFCVPICQGLSGTTNAMRVAAENAGLNFDFLDTYVTAEVEWYCVTKAKELYEKGKTLEEIKEILNEVVESASTLLIPVDMDHLKRGGRVTPAAALLAGLLKICPVLRVDKTTGGTNDVIGKVRTLSKAKDYVINFMKEQGVDERYNAVVAYVHDKKECEEMVERVKKAIPSLDIYLIPLISAVGAHTGAGVVAVQFYKRIEE